MTVKTGNNRQDVHQLSRGSGLSGKNSYAAKDSYINASAGQMEA